MALEQRALQQLDPHVRSYIQNLDARYEVRDEEYRLPLFKRFSRSSEQESSQQQLFEEAEQAAETTGDTEGSSDTITVDTHQRKKCGRKPIDESVPRVDILHDIHESEKQCPCGYAMARIGEEVS